MPVFDTAEQQQLQGFKNAILLVTSGGMVPIEIQIEYNLQVSKNGANMMFKRDALTGEYCTIHGGFDPVYANEIPDRVAP